MLSPEKRLAIMQQKLENAFRPVHLEIIDESDKHRGHPGARHGAGHYRLRIAATCFQHQTKLSAHRAIYDALAELIPGDIHALSIEIQLTS